MLIIFDIIILKIRKKHLNNKKKLDIVNYLWYNKYIKKER